MNLYGIVPRLLPLLLAAAAVAAPAPGRFEKPRAAIIISQASFQRDWQATQMSGHGWTGIANLAGIPYDTLFLSDVVQPQVSDRYAVLVFAQCFAAEDALARRLQDSLAVYLKRGGGVIIDGRLAAEDETGKPRDHAALDSLLGVDYGGVQGDPEYRIVAQNNRHFISRGFEASQYLSQPMAAGLNILQFPQGAGALLITTNGKRSWPFLSTRSRAGSQLVLFSDLTTTAGATSIFRNEPPQGFYANRVLDAAIRSLQWAAYGDPGGPIPAPQISNANMTAIVRLDADLSPNADYQKQTLQFLIDTAEQTGVVPIYAWVSAGATKAGWDKFAMLGQRIVELGGRIGTHSKNHRARNGLTDAQWKVELDDSVQEIEENMARVGAKGGKVEWFINPGDTIRNDYYERIARQFRLYMTHGFEQDTPVGFGNMTWYTGPHKNLVVLDNTPSPDYQWFYDPTWSYTTAQITSYQEATLDHIFYGIGRGMIYNQMWHDYGISSMPVTQRKLPPGTQPRPDRIKNTNMLPMYEALRAKFGTLRIYCPEPDDLANKALAMAQWDYSWRVTGPQIEISLDLGGLRLDETPQFVGGMGIRIDNTTEPIQSVTIDGRPHRAFSDHVVILPNLTKGPHNLIVTVGPASSRSTRLIYVSKRMPSIASRVDGLAVELLAKAKARMAFYSEKPAVLVGADYQEWNRRGDHELDAFVVSDRTVVLRKPGTSGFGIVEAHARVLDFQESAASVRLTLDKSAADSSLRFRTNQPPKSVRVNGAPVPANTVRLETEIVLPALASKTVVQIAL